ncbi:tyrosine-type recombinase/integrase (plasmid) [Arcobacter cryaerophilus gv. pseudocryaerophilus]|uniref:Tyrosine-type recombinase/integrase n=2 Tax=Arcobacteraceae TaxID=2808963 RepID=A0AAU0P831_9BACT|nr:tyrosine-type recombinase/integrase [Arcobacter sp. AZ-2023]WPD04454.1 tyrosine-type recombinase/integrase [Arcobacter sp. DSM 115972]
MLNQNFALEVERFYGHFVNELKLTNKSKNTIISYNTTIKSFIEFIKQYDKKLNFDNFKKIDLLNFLEYKNIMLEKHTELKMSSKKLYVTHLKTFFSFINENLDTDIKLNTIFKLNIKTPARTPKGVENYDVKILENYLTNLNLNNLLNVRTSLILKILLYSGARRGEILALKIEDFKEDDELYIINTIGKGDKERILYIPLKFIQKEVNYYKNLGINYVATTKHGKVMDGSQIYRFLNNVYKKIGIKYSGAHILRHTFAKAMIAKDLNIVTVKELLGHASIQTTMIYTNPNQKEIQKSYLKSMNLK